MPDTLNVVLAGGGTAGHISPMLAIARALEETATEGGHPTAVHCTMVGTASGMETRLVPAAGYALDTIDRVPMPRRPTMDLVRLPSRFRRAVAQAGDILDRRRADVVVGVGGYVSTPVYLAAARRRVPVVIHEANVRAGLANRVGARRAAAVATAFPETVLPGALHVGMPMRREISALDREAAREPARRALGLDPSATTVVVTGGSSGALNVNRTIAAALPALAGAGLQVLHLTGRGKQVLGPDGDPVASPGYHQVEYLEGMEQAYAAADLIVARSGAGTVCELAAVGLPAVFVPLPIGNGEQALNARGLVTAQGAVLVKDESFTADWVRRELIPLALDAGRLERMSAASAALGIRDADQAMARLVLNAAGGPR
ncbi:MULTISPECIES: undecaprenyldiphospho-muramoylpentapeptide beta-N-acetylglucosaminyltransferase [Micrococcaceae]|uniref:undecaprenyldiphospho-muramoylpentapeptide beta-N-acetylglucosaminyltransferase n=1 Tax=Micrococcaceae TaxID=1268 RepID=UPI00160915C4|nr:MULTISPECIES: undecaprenyldiphospho-muramoylpentapeptide beta-N-acetylglucosaminyltransferase [Micrococcaceae]MBB5749188.1 UDP-N-acetylglucosamine--N-acetylmuramyl-(pentapeptide) pyrophosphoryl-undecaprenol N-acetylglucosamine transferase [Micrococcus sp. TA1]HRO29387.1 undecaprenyldiphospho-muramoylpentapeptide beta-N-acetylglucosaminyltransferase [Citricoccus sp.]HRO93006.1 undecaprenyldiphospho-muramoylpentapeptide beta-N-acetylglucosaminyltransferase [Citricoccus sp.]